MKNLCELLVLLGLVIAPAVVINAQSARGLYVGYSPRKATKVVKNTGSQAKAAPSSLRRKSSTPVKSSNAATPTGMPGTKVVIELLRNGVSSRVSPNEIFRSGDQIRLRLQTNFQGYISLVNVGSSGKIKHLYPEKGKTREVFPSRDFMVPESGAWIKFDDTPGVELLMVVISSEPLEELDDGYQEAREAGSRDLTMAYEEDAFYAVWPEKNIADVVSFTLRLAHGRQ
jgi:hypothetical protein